MKKKQDIARIYHSPLKSIFSKKKSKVKGGSNPLQMSRPTTFIHPEDTNINMGMTAFEFTVAQAELSQGYTWLQSSIEPKTAGKKWDWDQLEAEILFI